MWRRRLILILLGASLGGAPPAGAAQSPQTPLAATAIPQFVQPLPVLDVAGGSIKTITGNDPVTVRMCEFDANVLPPINGVQQTTRVWGYSEGTCPEAVQDTYIGPVMVSERGVPRDVTWVNDLGDADTTGVLAYKYSTDQTLHWADPLGDEENECAKVGGVPAFGSDCAQNYAGPIPAAVHLHGGEVPAELDGGPDSWFTSDGQFQGDAYYAGGATAGNAARYRYPNSQEAAPIWFHDHTLGATRLNVYAGLAGAYIITDPTLGLPSNLPGPGETIPLVIQDRSFDTNGQLFMPADSAGGVLSAPNPEHPYWVPEFVGDTIVVNGKAWPFLDVEARRYRFLFLNGSNARGYDMSLTDPVSKNPGPPLWVIGTDGGYLDRPVKVDPVAPKGQPASLAMMPGERYEAIIDFAGYTAGTVGPNGVRYSGKWVLRNTARTPFPAGAPALGTTTGRIMQFVVGASTEPDDSYNPATGGDLRIDRPIVRLANATTGALATGVTPAKTRQLTLNEVMAMPKTATDPVTGAPTAYPGGPLEVLLNNTKLHDPVSEGVTEGETEVWEIVNLTADAHPIHLHLAQFQVQNRQAFNLSRYNGAYAAAYGGAVLPAEGPPLPYDPTDPRAGGKYGGNPNVNPYLQGPARPPVSYEAGWKDTVIAYPGQVTRLVVRWAPTDRAITGSPLTYAFDPSGSGGYVWHCHIVDHEDNEMMRHTTVTPDLSAERPYQKGIDY